MSDCPNIVRIPVPNEPAVVRLELEPSIIRLETPGLPGRDGAGTILMFPINQASSFTAQHNFSFAPNVVLLDSSGELVETDVIYSNGQVILPFPEPFTGTLYLG
jgi:hypothetical protein